MSWSFSYFFDSFKSPLPWKNDKVGLVLAAKQALKIAMDIVTAAGTAVTEE